MVTRHFRHQDVYYEQRQQLIQTYPHVLVLDRVHSISEIDNWIKDVHVDCRYHVFLYRTMEFGLGYDFFFRQSPDAAMFKLAWGGNVDDCQTITRPSFYIASYWDKTFQRPQLTQ